MSSATCCSEAPKENSAPAVFSIRRVKLEPRPGKAVERAGYGLHRQPQTLFAGEAFPGAGMEDEILGAEGEGALHFPTQGRMELARTGSVWLQRLTR